MVKRAPLDILLAGTVQPGKYLVLAGGQVGDVEEAVDAGRQVAAEHLIDEVFLADIHPRVVEALVGTRMEGSGEALGLIETATVAAGIEAADAGIQGATVTRRGRNGSHSGSGPRQSRDRPTASGDGREPGGRRAVLATDQGSVTTCTWGA